MPKLVAFLVDSPAAMRRICDAPCVSYVSLRDPALKVNKNFCFHLSKVEFGAYRKAMQTREMAEPVSVDVTTSLLGNVVEWMSADLAAAATAGCDAYPRT